jgi:hypothetical protein
MMIGNQSNLLNFFDMSPGSYDGSIFETTKLCYSRIDDTVDNREGPYRDIVNALKLFLHRAI